MANIIELKTGERPPTHEFHALVVVGPHHPPNGAPIMDRRLSRTFFAGESERDIALIIGRAIVWADARSISKVYVRRES